VLRRIFGPKRDEVRGGWRKLNNEKLHNLYSLPSANRMNKSWRMVWAGNVARMGMKRNEYRILLGKLDGKRPLGGQRCRWVNNVEMDLTETGWGGMSRIDLSQDRDHWRAPVNMVMNVRAP
jgi:hypothetical protein